MSFIPVIFSIITPVFSVPSEIILLCRVETLLLLLEMHQNENCKPKPKLKILDALEGKHTFSLDFLKNRTAFIYNRIFGYFVNIFTVTYDQIVTLKIFE